MLWSMHCFLDSSMLCVYYIMCGVDYVMYGINYVMYVADCVMCGVSRLCNVWYK